jgi:hypothetical protein
MQLIILICGSLYRRFVDLRNSLSEDLRERFQQLLITIGIFCTSLLPIEEL